MPEDSKAVVKSIVTWGALATVVGILFQAILYGFLAGGALAKKADHAEVDRMQEDFTAHIIEQAEWTGHVDEKLETIVKSLEKIENRTGGP